MKLFTCNVSLTMTISTIWMTTKSVSCIHSSRISTRPWVLKLPSFRNGNSRTLYWRGSKARGKRQSSYLTSALAGLRPFSAGIFTTTHRAQLINISNVDINFFILLPMQSLAVHDALSTATASGMTAVSTEFAVADRSQASGSLISFSPNVLIALVSTE